MLPMPKYRNPVSLIPGGCPQFLDYEAPLEWIEDVKYAFQEIPVPQDRSKVQLHAFRPSEEDKREYEDELEPGRFYNGDGYELKALKTLDPWIDQWLPIPFLRTREQNWPGTEDCKFEYGPSNWARARLSYSSDKPDHLRLVLVFDMQVEKKRDDKYAALTPEDVDANAHFSLAWRFRDNSWFLDLPWVEEWIRELWNDWRRKNRRRASEDDPAFAHLASYLTYLEVLWIASKHNSVYVVRPDASPCVDVDLVLDIGNSRTTGMLVETRTQKVTKLTDSYLLQLRDMSKPEFIYTDPFETRVEFAEICYGNDALSLRSGRRTPAFAWPSPVRIGVEASRLATRSRSGKGYTGMSSPKRYLWDESDWKASWRFNTGDEKSPYVTRGPLVQKVNSSGTPLCCMDDILFTRNPVLKKQERESAFESYFTRSSLMMFLLVEIIQQALLTINSPGQRCRRQPFDQPRRLRQIIFTVPAGMPKAEQKIYVRWAKWAVRVLWDALGWSEYYIGQRKSLPRGDMHDYRTSPLVRCEWDEATCTQLVYIYNEIIHQFQGDGRQFCEFAGRERKFGDKTAPSVRVATIDIGGGTTDLSITTFELDGSATPRLIPHPDFHDGFNLAGDDILRAVICDHVLVPLGEALARAGAPDAANALASLFGREAMNESAETKNQRIQFIRQIAVPAGLSLLELYEQCDLRKGDTRTVFKLKDCFKGLPQEDARPENRLAFAKFPAPGKAALEYARNYLVENGGQDDFDILDLELVMDARRMDDTVRSALHNILANLCEVINLYDCDALLLTGRPSRWPGVVDAVYSLMPVPPGRIIPMADYRVGSWYPFSDARGNMTDPKTTVVVGAILCALAEGNLEGFSLDSRNLSLMSTARHIGEMEINGQIKKEKVWFNVDPEKNASSPEVVEIPFQGPLSIGFRQLDAERWTTTRYYYLDFKNEPERMRGKAQLPFQTKIRLILEEPDEENELDEGEFEIEEAIGTGGDDFSKSLEMRLQTLPRDDGFWLDTGTIFEN